MVYVALLRGINVGGHMVKMERLRGLFAELGFARVRTYIQSGNVFFESPEDDREALTQTIEQHLRQALGYAVPVFLRTIPELEHVLSLDPLKGAPVPPDQRLCIVFAANPIPDNLALPLRSPKGDMEILHVTEREALVVWYIINGRPPASDDFLAKTLGSTLTTRFFHTTAKMVEAAKQG
jgi:uncharacterized protein (DUF1697 family)